MRRREGFEVTWQAEDGYVGGARPHSFYIAEDDLDEDMDELDVRKLFDEVLQDEFEQHVSPSTPDEDRFVEWAMEKIKAMKEATA